MCLHENGSISVRVRRKALIVASTPSAASTPVDQSFVGLTGKGEPKGAVNGFNFKGIFFSQSSNNSDFCCY